MVPDFVADKHILVLRKWHALNKGMEFRCFVAKNMLIGICQRDTSVCYEFLLPLKTLIVEKITKFFNDNLKNVKEFSEMENYELDIFIDVPPNYKVWLLDLNPWIPFATDSLLFEWEELENWQVND